MQSVMPNGISIPDEPHCCAKCFDAYLIRAVMKRLNARNVKIFVSVRRRL